MIHVHPPPSQPPGPSQQNTTRRWSREGCNSSKPTGHFQQLVVDHLAPSSPSLLLILWDGSSSECHNSQHRKQPESVHISGEWRETTWLLLAGGGRRISYLISCVLSGGDSYDRAGIAGPGGEPEYVMLFLTSSGPTCNYCWQMEQTLI